MCDSLRTGFECPPDETFVSAYTIFQYVWCAFGFLALTLAIVQLLRLQHFTKFTFLRNGIMHPNPVELVHIVVLIGAIIWNIRDPDPLGWWSLYPPICIGILQRVVTLILLLLVFATFFTWVRIILKLNGKIEQISTLDWIERILNIIIIPLVLSFTIIEYIHGPFWLYRSLVLASETFYVLVMILIDWAFVMPSFRMWFRTHTRAKNQLGIYRIYRAIIAITIVCLIGIVFGVLNAIELMHNRYDYHSNPPNPPALPTSPWKEGIIGFVQVFCLFFFLVYFHGFITNDSEKKSGRSTANRPKRKNGVAFNSTNEDKKGHRKNMSTTAFDIANIGVPDGYDSSLGFSLSNLSPGMMSIPAGLDISSPNNKTYHKKSIPPMMSTFQKSPTDAWELHHTENGKAFYFNRITEENYWVGESN